MKTEIIQSSLDKQQVEALLNRDVPTYRQAYSDRAAWLMACLSELAYVRFNPLISDDLAKRQLLSQVGELMGKQSQSSLLKMIESLAYDHLEEKKLLICELAHLRMQLVETFDEGGTQAILVSCSQFLILSFRGTESDSLEDIKTDIKAISTRCESGGMVHSGFNEAYGKVAPMLQEVLNRLDFKHKPLLITGHSLGGALATIAAKRLRHQGGIAACYTFGSPRVGDETWVMSIKTPIYRLVNAADCVTMMPPGADAITAMSWVLRFIPKFGETICLKLQAKFGGYYHGGDMRYMTHCINGEYRNVQLLVSVSIFRRIKGLIIKNLSWKKALADHSIAIYRKKLMMIANKRAPKNE
ncbi:lipase family protein [Shewanella surugensis]|uniref:Lipase family protein n=1 Tax=Shewanella surugensis TaxID=212020 RepID=A0ABT0LC86_9GAMM|nr:lipase family protein [Shewanella surugensis]MCL1124962.1 lipase family protein [Shewanella surugensis]